MDIWEAESLDRITDEALSCSFGVSYLDESLFKMLPDDITVIGALSGAGKTELCSLIVTHNCQQKKNVLWLALEAAKNEPYQRLKYREISKLYYERKQPGPVERILNYRDWKLGLWEKELTSISNEVNDKCRNLYETLKVMTPNLATFFRQHARTLYENLQDQFDLILLDHLHVIEVGEKETEYTGLKKNITELRDLVTKYRTPLILISHLRKCGNSQSIVPQMEEIHGSSDIYKLANNVITFGQVYEVNGDRAPTNATGFQVLKARWSLGMGYIGLVTFNWKVKEYASTYSLLKVKDRWATKVEWVDYSSKPFWAQSMVERSYV